MSPSEFCPGPSSDEFSDTQDYPQDENDTYRLLFLQIRALLNAAPEVQIDDEIIQDLLQAIPEDRIDEFVRVTKGLDLHEEDADLDLSVLFNVSSKDSTWKKQDIQHMLRYLKQHGMSLVTDYLVFKASGANPFIKRYVVEREIPIPKLLEAFGMHLCPELVDKQPPTLNYCLRVAMYRELQLRDKLPQYNTIADAVELIRSSQRILILTGAGISVSCGIPDFRSRNGVYASLGQYELDDPQQMFDINYFKENPAVHLLPHFVPSPCHRFLKLVEDKGKLLRNYTQNIDTLETKAGVKRVLQCHGSFATASCLVCRRQVPGSEIENEILSRKVPLCPVCNASTKSPLKDKKKPKKLKAKWDSEDEDDEPLSAFPPGIMKPDITFFGEKLPDEFDNLFDKDREQVDLLVVIGTSLKVAPVADILYHLPHSIPQILINKTPVRHINPDIILLGNADDIVQHLCNQLEWELPSRNSDTPSLKRSTSDFPDVRQPIRVANSHVWLFEGAEGGNWLEHLREELADESTESEELSATMPALDDSPRVTKKIRV